MLRRDPLANPEPLIRRVYAYVAYRVGDGADAEDITSAAFERALRYRSNFDPALGEPVAWLVGIARRCITDHYQSLLPAERQLPDIADDAHVLDSAERRVDLNRAVAHLEERDRELLALRYGADMSAKQIGVVLEMKTNAVEVALHRLLGRLRGELERTDIEDASSTPAEARAVTAAEAGKRRAL